MGLLTNKKKNLESAEKIFKRGIRECLLNPFNIIFMDRAGKTNTSDITTRASFDEFIQSLIAYAESVENNHTDFVTINKDYNHHLTCKSDETARDFVHNGLIITWYNTMPHKIEILDLRTLKKYNTATQYKFTYYPCRANDSSEYKEFRVDVSRTFSTYITKYTKMKDVLALCQQAHKGGIYRCIIAADNSRLCRWIVNGFINKIGKI